MMNDETEQFERRLKRQSLKKIPGEWREEIVGQASSLSPFAKAKKSETGRMPVLLSICRALLWPNPKAWAGLAAIWLFIFAVNFSIRDKTPVVAENISSPSPEMLAELRQQQKMFVELLGVNETRVADRQKIFLPKPQSECVEFLTA
jgi:hypothetical protein